MHKICKEDALSAKFGAKKVNLRTEYTIMDEQFEAFMQKVQEGMKGQKLGAGYWFGAMRVENK